MARKLALFALAGLVLSGCAGVATESANIAKDKLVLERNIAKARAGDPEAQFKVGSSLCCSLMEDRAGFYDTRQSLTWLCMAGRQGYAPAMLKIGQILSGDTINGVRVIRRVASAAVGSIENLPAAYTWTRNSADRGNREAVELTASLWTLMDRAERERAGSMYQEGLKAECGPDLLKAKGA